MVFAARCLITVFRDTPVSRAISRIDSFCRKCIRRMMFNSPMWITPLPPSLTHQGKVRMAQFSVTIMRLTGSLLSENQQLLKPEGALLGSNLLPLNHCYHLDRMGFQGDMTDLDAAFMQ